MEDMQLVRRIREAAGMTQSELAADAGTSRTTISAYENGRKSPTVDTLQRLAAVAGVVVRVDAPITFRSVPGRNGRPVVVAEILPRLELDRALATVVLPLHLNWSDPGRVFRLIDRRERLRVYEIVLREGGGEDILRYIDGALLVDAWDDLVLPREVRSAWAPVVDGVRRAVGSPGVSAA
jgi:transcriptional regulator with XRE-family HTH domain